MSSLIAVIVSIASLAVIPLAQSQSGAGAVVPRFGSLAPSLTEDDLQQIRKLATRMGGELWVLFGDFGFLADRWTIAAYLRPGIVTGAVRTGQLVWVRADLGPDGTAKRAWRIDSVAMTAQVPLAGRAPDAITGEADANWPFRVVGEWTAEELVSLVAFIRSSPPSTNPARGLAQVNGALPLVAIWRQPDGGARVMLRFNFRGREFHDVRVTKSGVTWTVASVHLVIED